ncbi:MAG: nicotinate (nicotinamide) nucleotide adenylyltransferase [Planctomycetes bacterium]|nr:nicotinate (nicotinamide) nucleotide adenylyltransferase [Planctomycetota bacterium]
MSTEVVGWPAVRRLGLFGGSFDPVHRGHEHVARAAERAFGLERVLWMPAARPPHKPERILAEAGDRVAMLELALAGEPRWSVSRLELERSGPSYTIDTVRALPAALGLARDVELYLLIGGDNLVDFTKWREAHELLRRVQPVIVVRRGDEREVASELARGLPAELAAKVERGLVVEPLVPISSTELRERLARGEACTRELAPAVGEYVRARGIYAPRRA